MCTRKKPTSIISMESLRVLSKILRLRSELCIYNLNTLHTCTRKELTLIIHGVRPGRNAATPLPLRLPLSNSISSFFSKTLKLVGPVSAAPATAHQKTPFPLKLLPVIYDN